MRENSGNRRDGDGDQKTRRWSGTRTWRATNEGGRKGYERGATLLQLPEKLIFPEQNRASDCSHVAVNSLQLQIDRLRAGLPRPTPPLSKINKYRYFEVNSHDMSSSDGFIISV